MELPPRRPVAVVQQVNVYQHIESGLFIADARWMDPQGATHQFSQCGETAEGATAMLRAIIEIQFGVIWTPQVSAMAKRPGDEGEGAGDALPPAEDGGVAAAAPAGAVGGSAPELTVIEGDAGVGDEGVEG